jgi:hypothetical protein
VATFVFIVIVISETLNNALSTIAVGNHLVELAPLQPYATTLGAIDYFETFTFGEDKVRITFWTFHDKKLNIIVVVRKNRTQILRPVSH